MNQGPLEFNPPPGWPKPPPGWTPPKGWTPDPAWPPAPPGWELWIALDGATPGVDEPADPTPGEQGATPTADGDSPAHLRAEIGQLRALLTTASDEDELVQLDDAQVLQAVGIYRYHHPLEHAVAYKDRLADLGRRIAQMARDRKAIERSTLFTYDNSLAKGRRMTKDLSRLMLRAYNAEVESSIRSLRAGNVVTAKKRIEATRRAIARLGTMMEMRIGDAYHALRMEEVELAADYLMKKQEEREAAREERARLREEKKAQAELAAERERLDKERSHFANALEALKQSGDSDPELEAKLAEIDQAIEQNDYRVANIRAGYVYVISNRGALGRNMVKIGLTRRLEPQQRVRELSGASVPFRFDVHAIFFSEDAVALEADLHRHFADRRVNFANPRKEFFFATPAEVREALVERVGNLLEFNEGAEATEYFQSVGAWPEGFAPP